MTADPSTKIFVRKRYYGSRFFFWFLLFLIGISFLALFQIWSKINQYQTELISLRSQVVELRSEETANQDKNSAINDYSVKSETNPQKGEAFSGTADAMEDSAAPNETSAKDQPSIQGEQGERRVMRNKMSRFSGDSMPALAALDENTKSRSSLISELINKSAAGQARMERLGRAFRILRSGIIILGFMLIYCIYISRQRENEDLQQETN